MKIIILLSIFGYFIYKLGRFLVPFFLFNKHKKDKDKKSKTDKISAYNPLTIQDDIEKLQLAIEGLEPNQKTLKTRYLKRIGQLQAKLEAYDEIDTPKTKLDF